MTPTEFCHWLDGYLSARRTIVGVPDAGSPLDDIRSRLDRVSYGPVGPRALLFPVNPTPWGTPIVSEAVVAPAGPPDNVVRTNEHGSEYARSRIERQLRADLSDLFHARPGTQGASASPPPSVVARDPGTGSTVTYFGSP